MRAYELPGESIDSLREVERPVPKPGPGQVLVRIRAASLNFRDLLIANGTYPRGPTKDRLVPLSDGAGEVVELGPGATRLKPKDRVMGAFFEKWLDGPFDFNVAISSARGGSIDGVLAEYVLFDEAAAVKIPDGYSFEEAATLPCAGVTAWVALMELGPVRAGQTLLAMGTGGVSIFALQLAKLAGASVILTSSHEDKLARGKALGADQTINYRSVPRWDAAARELTGGRGVDHLVEVGGEGTLATSLRAVRSGGRIALVGQLTGAMADRDLALKNEQGVNIDSVFVGSVRQLTELSAGVSRIGLRPVIDRVFSFDAALEAYRHLERGAHFGKVVIAI
jgi:NADPH:quinone reductase-like Zn-dependent oxidoreductase